MKVALFIGLIEAMPLIFFLIGGLIGWNFAAWRDKRKEKKWQSRSKSLES